MLRVATRGSALARWQAQRVIDLLGEPAEMVVITTEGDRRPDVPIWEVGGRGVFVKEVQAAVLDGRADLGVHSAKDLPSSAPPPGLALAAVPRRGDPRDALVGSTLAGLAPGAVVATGSVRRRAQLSSLRPDVTFASLRGSIDTRLEKVPRRGAAVVAAAALARLDRLDRAAEVLDPSVLLPQVAQGALAVECQEADEELRERVAAKVEHPPSRRAVDAERAFLAAVGGGCDVPIGALATLTDGALTVRAMVASLDGRMVLRASVTGDDPSAIAGDLADRLLGEGLADLVGV